MNPDVLQARTEWGRNFEMKERSMKGFRLAGILLALAALGVAILWFGGAFERGKVEPGQEEMPPGLPPPEMQGQALRENRPAFYVAVGTIRSRTEATVAAQVSGRVTSVRVDAGNTVVQGDLLATLDSQEMDTRVGQARSGLDAAKAELADAQLHYGRIQRLLPERAATQVQMDAADARLKQAKADPKRFDLAASWINRRMVDLEGRCKRIKDGSVDRLDRCDSIIALNDPS